MELFDLISEDIKKAMLAKNKIALDALRGIKKEFLEAKTAKGGETFDNDAALKILQKMIKQRKDAAQIYNTQNRADLAEAELAQVVVIEQYLPAQMSEAELETTLKEIIAQIGAAGPQDMGRVMGVATKQLSGKAESRLISEKVKQLLNN